MIYRINVIGNTNKCLCYTIYEAKYEICTCEDHTK